MNSNQRAFFALLRAGLWEQTVRLSEYEPIDYPVIYTMAEEQSVFGLITAGLEHVEKRTIPKQMSRLFMGETLQIEQSNIEMNVFISSLVDRLRDADVTALLVKGQGIAQCYTRPLWRTLGDVDLLFDTDSYFKAKDLLIPLAESIDEEDNDTLHLGMTIKAWLVELHGSMRGGVSKRQNLMIDAIQDDTFNNGKVRVWNDNGTEVYLPSPDNDIIFIFNHFVDHFYRGGCGVRQICDWCRLLWTYKDTIDRSLLEERLHKMGFLCEWKAFAGLAVEYLGMPVDAMPLYDGSNRWSRKARRIVSFIIEVGNFGQNRDNSFYKKYPYIIFKAISFSRHIGDFFRCLFIFPKNSVRVFTRTFINGLRVMTKGVLNHRSTTDKQRTA
jgi:hypothetical protein